jgi:hypothetical protein
VETRGDAREMVDRLARRTGGFKGDFDKAVDHSLMDGTRMEDRAKHRADDLNDAAKKLADVFHDKKDKNHPAVREQVDKTLAAAADVDRVMRDHLRSDCNGLAAVYDLRPIE